VAGLTMTERTELESLLRKLLLAVDAGPLTGK
jgi:hypothetical protein